MTIANRATPANRPSSNTRNTVLLTDDCLRITCSRRHQKCTPDECGYEQQKQMHVRTVLADRHFTNALEIGCAEGALSLLLAQQCVRLLCCDPSPGAVQLTQRRLAGLRHARVERRRLPMQWPEGRFDLIVLNEACNRLDANDTRRLVMRARMALTPHGMLIACHRQDIAAGGVLHGDAIHQHLQSGLSLPRVLHYRNTDLLIDAWHANAVSAAL